MKKISKKGLFTRVAAGVVAISLIAVCCGCGDTPPEDNFAGKDYMAAPIGAPDYSAHENDRMLIGAWNSSPRPNYKITDEELDAAKEAGIDFLASVRVATNPGTGVMSGNLEKIKSAGLKAVLDLSGLSYSDICEDGGYSEVYPYLSDDVVMGINFQDEPAVSAFSKLEASAAAFMRDFPAKISYVNLLPNYATPGQLGTDTHQDYVETYANTVGSVTNLSYDFYPLVGEMSGTMVMSNSLNGLWLASLQNMANAAKSVNKDLWVFIQCMSFGAHNRAPQSSADITLQNYVNMCYGAKVLQYFAFNTPATDEFGEYDWGMLDRELEKTDNFYYVKEANEQLQKFAYAYLQFEWENVLPVTGSVLSDPADNGFDLLSTALTESEYFGIEANSDTLVGQFHDDNGYKGYMVANMTDPMKGIVSTVKMTFNATRVLVCSKNGCNVVEIPTGEYTFNLDLGDGRFIIPFNV